MRRLLAHTHVLSAALGLLLVFSSSAALAQYQVTYLTSNLTGKAKFTDPLLKNAWGLAYSPDNPFWISDEASGWSTLYNAHGDPQSLQVIIPPATGTGAGTPTGIVYNGSTEFQIDTWTSVFLFATLDGTISGWSAFNPSAALIGATSAGSSYTGLAITNKTSGNSLFAADAANNKVDIYDGNFNLTGSFTDPEIPAGFAPFGIQDIDGQVYVSFAATSGGPGGYIDIFSETGTLVKRFAHGKPLNQPWGFAVAPANFGTFSKALLITNNTSAGAVNAFSLTTGKLLGTLSNSSGKALTINGLWGIEFGGGGGSSSNGMKNQLFFTAGPNDTNGYFGVIASK
ncbi:MAG: TIGR03118 family protein [Candidatus Sulfotelmatobacter sp.]